MLMVIMNMLIQINIPSQYNITNHWGIDQMVQYLTMEINEDHNNLKEELITTE